MNEPMTINRIRRSAELQNQFQVVSNPTSSLDIQTHACDFYIHYHPFVQQFFERLGEEKPIKRLLSVQTQTSKEPGNKFEEFYKPAPAPTVTNRPKEVVEFGFDRSGAYSAYNTELFFHAPILIANRLSQSQRFEEAQKWYHYIFDPTERGDSSNQTSAKRFWRFTWFQQQNTQRIQEIINNLNDAAVDDWIKNPFLPHIVARYRPQAYMMHVVMKYLDNLIGWADNLFRQDTLEAINEASQLYVLAANILGPKPRMVPKVAKDSPKSYAELKNSDTTGFRNPTYDVELEDTFAKVSGYKGPLAGVNSLQGILKGANYFCLAPNSKLLGYWDTVGDRLFKIRNSMNIDGAVRDLALFAPPIDPALLISAAAAGLDLGSVLSDLQAPMPHYRFQIILQKAAEFCNEVKAFGGALLSALEKRDGESLSLLRTRHEKNVLDAALHIREKQVQEATAASDGLKKNRLSAEERYKNYQRMLGKKESDTDFSLPQYNSNVLLEYSPEPAFSKFSIVDSQGGLKILDEEKNEIEKTNESNEAQKSAGGDENNAAVANAFPNINIQPWGVGTTLGGQNFGAVFSAIANGTKLKASIISMEASKSAKIASLIFRQQDWINQKNLAQLEVVQLDRQILASEIRVDIAQKELANQQLQIRQSSEVLAFLDPENPASKFTSLNLYNWMIGKLMELHFQSYRMAYDLAKKAERCYRYELGIDSSNFIKFGYWDNAKKGLLAGEQLGFSLKQMEKAYLDHNKREFEITKHISLVHAGIVKNSAELKASLGTGLLRFSLTESVFNSDFDKHYFRRIKSVSISIPCIAGPYTSVSATLRQLKSIVQIKPGDAEENKREYTAAISAIATSSAQNDSGMFELNFRDERYLPFEGSGAISEWQLEMAKMNKDSSLLNSITDIIIHLKYTARE